MVIANFDIGILLTSREQRLIELEGEFSNWANSVEDSLFHYKKDLKNRRVHLDESLVNDLELYRGQLRELKEFDYEYKALSHSNESHPDCSRARDRLHTLYNLAQEEFKRITHSC